MKRENGSGSVKFLGKNHHRPYAAIITLGWEVKGDKAVQKRKALGYFRTRSEALKCLNEYWQNPHDVVHTFAYVYEKWFATVEGVTETTLFRHRKSYERSETLHHKVMADIRLADLEEQLQIHSDITQVAKQNMKTTWSMMFEWAIAHDICTTNYAKLLHIKPGEKKLERKVFTREEIEMLWADNTPVSNLILIGIYSGWRPGELINFTVDNGVMYGGSKTEAGKDRAVPVHSKITNVLGEIPRFSSYREYRKAFQNKMLQMGLNHFPHDTRHTFATLCDEYDVKPDARAVLMGHTSKNVTERVYTHRTLETLKAEIEKIK